MSLEKAQEMIDGVTAYAKSVGLDYNYGTVQYSIQIHLKLIVLQNMQKLRGKD